MFPSAQKALPQIGTQAPEVVSIDTSCVETSDELDQQARRTILERDSVGISDRYSNIRHTSVLAIYKGLIGKRMYVSLQYFLDDGGTDLFCSQGRG